MMRARSDDSELERLRAENRYLKGLLAEREPVQEALATPEPGEMAPAHTQVQAPEGLEQLLRLFDTALSWIADYVFVCDLQGHITYANRARLRLWQRELKDVLGKTFFDLGYPSELAARIHAQIDTVIATREPLHSEAEYTSASGRIGFYDYILVPVFGNEGEVEAVAGSTRDISARHRERAALRESKELFRTTLHSIGDAVIATDATGHITFMNSVAEILTGWTFAEAAGRASSEVFRIINEQTRADVSSPIDRVLREGTIVGLANHTVVLARDGREYPIEDSGAPIRDEAGNLLGVVLVFRDVTESRRREQELQQSQERTRLIVETALDAVVEIGEDGRIIGWNAQAEQMFGWTREEAIGQLLADTIIPVSYRQAHLKGMRRYQETGQGPVLNQRIEITALHQDGHEFPVELAISPIRTSETTTFSAFVRDLTPQKQAAERRAHLVAIVHSSHDAIISKDLEGIITSWNPAAQRIYGYTAQEIIGKSKSLLIPVEMPEELPTILRRIRAGERIEHYETVRVRKDGTRIHLSISVSPVHDVHGNIVGASTIARDLSERLQHLREIEALNMRLKRSIQETHHRVKNNLQVISALAELQMEENQSMVPAAALARIGQHTRNLAAVHDLLTQEAKADAHADSISTRAALDKLIPLLQSTTGGRRIAYTVDDFRMSVQEGASLALLISELASNAVKHGRTDIKLTLTREGDRARLEVCDDGPGFPPGFDWRTAANTGLALIDSAGRYDLKGVISYENQDQGGARVVVTFPIAPT
jgi:PAS domain S-box-containing protein